MVGAVTAAEPLRHPADPDPVRATKATAVLALGVAAVVLGPMVGGVIPATLALILAREVRRELVDAKGYLIGTRRLERGVSLAWTGIALAAGAVVVATVRGLYLWAGQGGPDFDQNVK